MTAREYLSTIIDYGGEPRTIGSVISELQSEGVPERCIEAYLVGVSIGTMITGLSLLATDL